MSVLPAAPTERRRDLLWLAIGACVLFLPFLGARDLWNPNEPLYGQAVVEMSQRGDWLVPTVNGEVFAEKPPLYFWLALLAARALGGVDELTLRLPSAVAGVLGVLGLYVLVHPFAGRARARISAALFATTFVVFWSARAVQMDLLLAVCTLAAVIAVTRVHEVGSAPAAGWALAGAAAAAGFLTKGPVGLICPGLVVAAYLMLAPQRRRSRARHVALSLAVVGVVIAPWLVALWARGEPRFLREMFVRQNLVRFVEPWDHVEPWWYFLKYFWIDMAPWALLVPLAMALPDRDDATRRIDRLAWYWIAVIVLFFSLSASKRSPYILPLAPAVSILAGGVVERLVHMRLTAWRRRAVWGLLAALGVLLVAMAVYLRVAAIGDFPALALPGRAVALLLAAGGGAVLAGLMVRRTLPLAAPAAWFSCLITLYLLAAAWVLPAADAYKSARPLCEEINAHVAPRAQLRSYRFWKWRASYVYYSGRRIPRIETPQALRDYWQSDERVFLLVERWMLDEVRSVIGDVEPLAGAEVGDNAAFLFTNR